MLHFDAKVFHHFMFPTLLYFKLYVSTVNVDTPRDTAAFSVWSLKVQLVFCSLNSTPARAQFCPAYNLMFQQDSVSSNATKGTKTYSVQ